MQDAYHQQYQPRVRSAGDNTVVGLQESGYEHNWFWEFGVHAGSGPGTLASCLGFRGVFCGAQQSFCETQSCL